MTWGTKFFGDARVAYATLPAYNGGHSFFMSNKVCPTTKRGTPCFLACHRPSPLTPWPAVSILPHSDSL